ncbi:hypothetical protein RN629_17115 [Sphingomonadaceae bacterium jetA1]|jgi:hypothetical protein|uniref:hypothetical protein n=1 Tax=Facivitalis istanbulensis TaxID=3075838 RepID=UPI00347A5B08
MNENRRQALILAATLIPLMSRAEAAPPQGGGEKASSQGDEVSVWDFMTPQNIARCKTSDNPPDCTVAFTRAQQVSHLVRVPPGYYKLSNLRLLNGRALCGAGENASFLMQAAPDKPIIRCLSDETTGQISGARVEGFSLQGASDATIAAVIVEAYGGYAVWRSHFSFYASKCYSALVVQPNADGTNVFHCDFRITSETTAATAVMLRGAYITANLFLTQCSSWATELHCVNSQFTIVADGCVINHGQICTINAAIEYIWASRPPSAICVQDRGFNNVYLSPTINLYPSDVKKIRYALGGFSNTTFMNPQIIGLGRIAHPFAPTALPCVVMGGRSNALNKIEAIFDGSADDRDPRRITLLGNCAEIASYGSYPGACAVQREPVVAAFTCRVRPETQVLILEPSADLLEGRLDLLGAKAAIPDGWTLEIATTRVLRRLAWPAGTEWEGVPGTLRPGSPLKILWVKSAGRWMVIQS